MVKVYFTYKFSQVIGQAISKNCNFIYDPIRTLCTNSQRRFSLQASTNTQPSCQPRRDKLYTTSSRKTRIYQCDICMCVVIRFMLATKTAQSLSGVSIPKRNYLASICINPQSATLPFARKKAKWCQLGQMATL